MTSSSNRHRAYIRNLSYLTTEEDLEELFKKFEPTNILIPSYTVRFTRTDRQRPLGIAYAEFKTREDLEAVVKQFDGTILKKRQMCIKKHVAYDPKRRFFIRGRKPEVKKLETKAKVETSNKPIAPETKIEIASANVTTTAVHTVSVAGTVAKSELSKDTVYIPKAPAKTTDESLRDFFKEYGPARIYIFRNKKAKRGAINLKGSYVSVLAKLDSTQNNLDEIINNLKAQKLNGRHVVIKPAYKSKVEEVASKLKSPAAILGTETEETAKLTTDGKAKAASQSRESSKSEGVSSKLTTITTTA
ncbi:Regulator of rDNA transcription protein 5 [Spathaspora sp. JA1]|nr:Regulator of rDNA transcription protein 5 [Spathaspora sp. JA1]